MASAPIDCKQDGPSGLGNFSFLPIEIRRLIYNWLLTAPPEASSTWGRGSGVSTSIMLTSRVIYSEAKPKLYGASQLVKSSHSLPPSHALRQMTNIKFELRYETVNRADYEESIVGTDSLHSICDRVGLSLRHNQVLKDISISLLNSNQRKRGPKPLRSEAVRLAMQRALFPFAILPDRIFIQITGFDFLEWLELFEEMRRKHAGSELPIEMLLM